MGRQKITSLITCFTSDGDYFAILSPDGTVKVWNTGTGNLQAEWKDQEGDSSVSYTCMTCSFIGKKRKKEQRTFLLALGTSGGDVLAINVFTGERKWINNGWHSGGIAALSFANKGRILYTAGTDGMVSELNSETGEFIGKFKASKRPITSLALSCDEKLLAVASDKTRVFSLDTKKELLKFSSGQAQYIAISDDGKVAVSSVFGEKQLQLWACDHQNRSGTARAVLSMRDPPVMLECKSAREEGMVVLSVSEKGIAYMWNTMTISPDEVRPNKIVVNYFKPQTDLQISKKNRSPIIAARICDIEGNKQLAVLVAHGSLANLRFSFLTLTDPDPGENIYIDIDTSLQEISGPYAKEVVHELDGDYDINEPTMGEKLASLSLLNNDKAKCNSEKEPSPDVKPPSADSVHILLKQALHAEDHELLLNCLYTRDEKVIMNSISMLNPSDVLKLLNSLVSMIQSRGAVLICALPWLKSLFIQHASSIMSQESSLLILNSLYQLIESRVSTFGSAWQLFTCLDYLFAGIPDNEVDDERMAAPVIFEDKDSDEEAEDAMEADEESEQEFENLIGSPRDSEGSDVMSE